MFYERIDLEPCNYIMLITKSLTIKTDIHILNRNAWYTILNDIGTRHKIVRKPISIIEHILKCTKYNW
jgi:hypothetical protein